MHSATVAASKWEKLYICDVIKIGYNCRESTIRDVLAYDEVLCRGVFYTMLALRAWIRVLKVANATTDAK
jgi:hypothetical protein